MVCTGFYGEAIVNSVAEVTAQIKKGATDDGTISMKADFNVKKSCFALANVTPKFDEQFYPSTIVHGGQDTAISVFRGRFFSLRGLFSAV